MSLTKNKINILSASINLKNPKAGSLAYIIGGERIIRYAITPKIPFPKHSGSKINLKNESELYNEAHEKDISRLNARCIDD